MGSATARAHVEHVEPWADADGMRPYVIWAPPFVQSSAGVRALYVLCEKLREAGRTAAMELLGNGMPWYRGWFEVPLNVGYAPSEFTREQYENAIHVYPEADFGSPPDPRRCNVRWILNTPGHLPNPGSRTTFDEELLFPWSKQFLPEAPDEMLLQVSTIEYGLFSEDPSVKKFIDAYYVGKGRFRTEVEGDHFGLVEITAEWPCTREDVATLLRKTRTLYTYDDTTQLNEEAALCGCRVVLLPDEKELDTEWLRTWHAHSDEEREQLENFIRITQSYFR